MKVKFNNRSYELVFTDHALQQMHLRKISEADVIRVIESGKVKSKGMKGKYWVFMPLEDRRDNLVSASISIEPPRIVVITTLVNWSPK